MGKGPQLQNIPKVARSIFCAGDGCILIKGDYARAEAMFVAFDAEEEDLINVFLDRSRDLYREVAARAMGIDIGAVQGWLREVFKRVVHASNYGMGPLKFITVLRLAGINIEDLEIRGLHSPRKKSEYLLEGYHENFKRIRAIWQRDIKDTVRRTRVLYDYWGRRRTFLDRMDDKLFRKAFSFRPQSSIVGLANRSLIRLYERGEALVTQTHDDIVIEVPESDMQDASFRLAAAMTEPITLHGRTFTVPVDVKWGYNWGEMYDLSRPVFEVYREARKPTDVSPLGRAHDY